MPRSQVQQKVKIKEQILFVCQQLHYDDKIQMKHNYYIIIHTLMIWSLSAESWYVGRSVVVVFPLFSHTFCAVVYQYERLLFSLLLQSSLDYLRRLACHVMEKTVSTKWYYIIPLIFSKNTKEPKAPNHKSLKNYKKKSSILCYSLQKVSTVEVRGVGEKSTKSMGTFFRPNVSIG